MDVITQLLKDVPIPRMVKVCQKFDDVKIEDVSGEVYRQLKRPAIANTIRPGMKIAVTCGSRGIDNIALVIKTIIDFCREQGADPFIIPAMGSHGGASGPGQKMVCESLGVTEEYCRCPIKATMEVVRIGTTSCEDSMYDGKPVYEDKYAYEADGVIAVNRIKPHTSFVGPYESGLMKMLTIGLGKQKGAENAHFIGTRYMSGTVQEFGKVMLEKGNILFCVGLVENAYDKTCLIEALTKEEVPVREPELLKIAKEKMPCLLPGNADVLIVDQIGKNISGDGMDPHITGKFGPNFLASGGIPNFAAQRVAVLDLTDETEGQCMGIDAAYAISNRAWEKMDLRKTYPNAITANSPCAVPIIMKNDMECIQIALRTCIQIDKKHPDVIRIKDTLHVSEMYYSEGLAEKMKGHPQVEIMGTPEPMRFDKEGNLW